VSRLKVIEERLAVYGVGHLWSDGLLELAKFARHSPALKAVLLQEIDARLDGSSPMELSPIHALTLLDMLGELK